MSAAASRSQPASLPAAALVQETLITVFCPTLRSTTPEILQLAPALSVGLQLFPPPRPPRPGLLSCQSQHASRARGAHAGVHAGTPLRAAHAGVQRGLGCSDARLARRPRLRCHHHAPPRSPARVLARPAGRTRAPCKRVTAGGGAWRLLGDTAGASRELQPAVLLRRVSRADAGRARVR